MDPVCLRPCHKNSMKKSGFTLVEIMVAISIFVVVALAATDAFLNADRVSKKAQAMKTVIDNLHFALNMLSFDLQQGGSYHCLAAGDPALTNPQLVKSDTSYSYGRDCHWGLGGSVGGTGLVFRSPKTGTSELIIYKFDPETKRLYVWRSSSGASSFTPTTIDNLQITNFRFFVHNAESGPGAPRVFMTIAGQANLGPDPNSTNPSLHVPFQLETVVSERI